jgi:hypothetical protein
VKTRNHTSISQLPASRFPDPADLYFCDNCGRDLTKSLYRDRAPLWQPLRPMWCVCQCGRKYLSGGSEWDELTTWEREQRIAQLSIGVVLFAFLIVPVLLAYFALRYGGAALIAIVGIALIPSVLAAKPFGFAVLDAYEIIASIWRTRMEGKRICPVTTMKQWSHLVRPDKLPLVPIAVVIAVLIVGTRWIPYHPAAPSPISAFSSAKSSNTPQPETLFIPTKLPLSRAAHTAVPGAPGPEFKRIRVGPNEVDYIADDVTVRHFMPTLARPGAPRAYKEVHFGPDVTTRYFSSDESTDVPRVAMRQ